MKRFLTTAMLVATAFPAFASNVGASISVGQPGFYGRLDINNYPSPILVYPEPVVIQPVPVGVARQPLYLHVPPGHARDWGKHCRKYNACGQPVYFVQDNWYNEVYVPAYREKHGHGHDKGHGKGNGKGKGNS
jgi:hypothetical protein